MKKVFNLLLALLLVAGCSSQSNKAADSKTTTTAASEAEPELVIESYNILVPTGAPALAVVDDLATSEKNSYTITSGADLLVTELTKADTEYDIIIAPLNAGAKLIAAGKSDFKLAGIVTWGNLYLVGTSDANLESDTIAAFGEASVPGMVLKNIMASKSMTNEVTWGSAATDAQAALLGGQANVALLAEPAVTATMAKAKQSGKDVSIIADVQSIWEEIYGTYGFPQAAVFVKSSVYEANSASVEHYLDEIAADMKADADGASEFRDHVDAHLDELGLPSTDIAVNSYAHQNIHYGKASDNKQAVTDFLGVFNITLSDDAYLY